MDWTSMLEHSIPQTPLSEPVRGKWTIADFAHLKDIRDYMVRGSGELCIERARLMTRFLKVKGGLDYADPFTRQAEVMKHILVHKRPNVFPHELLAGSSTSKRKGVLFYPEFFGLGIWPELLTIPFKKPNPYLITVPEIMELDHDIMPFWMNTTASEIVRRDLGEEDLAWRMSNALEFFMCSKMVCQSHTIPDYKQVLAVGVEGLIAEANRRKQNASSAQQVFYQGIITVMEGIIEYAQHLSEECTRQAAKCPDAKRKTQLEKMAEICLKVPAQPPTTFWEAIQSIWTCMNALYQEQNNVGFSIGRIDQLLNPYLIRDLQGGTITRKDAMELLAHFWLKVGDNLPMVPETAEVLFAGTGSNQAITIGGCDIEGKKAINETTYLCLDVCELVHVRDPNLNARVRDDDPPEYTQRLAEVILATGATPSLINDSIVIPSLEQTGIKTPDARDYAQVGCLEPNSAGRTFGHTGAVLINVDSALELVLFGGDTRRTQGLGLKTPKFAELKTFPEFLDALKQQLRHILLNATRFNNNAGVAYRYLHPQPLLSTLFEGPMDRGKDLLEGSATYNSSGIAFIAMADLIDSVYAVKKLVYDEMKVTPVELLRILENNFEGRADIFQYVINKIPHFGNGIKEVDDIGHLLVNYLYEETMGIENYRGGRYLPGYWSMTIHSGFGALSGAFPHGKKKGEPFASGLTPVSFGIRNGPTGIFQSLIALDSTKMPNGMALNMKFNKSLFKNQEKIESFKALMAGYFHQGGMQAQFTIHDAETLKDAKKHPENYPDLMVRISGYTAYFVDLNEHMMDEIINRTILEI